MELRPKLQIRRRKWSRWDIGGLSTMAAIFGLAVSGFVASPATAHTMSSPRSQSDPLSSLADRGVVLHPGAGYGPAGSPAVRDVQRLLAHAGYSPGRIDGRYGPMTEAEVMRYQANYGLRVDGIAGPQTLLALTAQPFELRQGAGFQGGGSPAVRDVQRLLARAGYSPGPLDGRFGPLTEGAVRRYQAHSGLVVTGIVGSQMVNDLRSRGRREARHGWRDQERHCPNRCHADRAVAEGVAAHSYDTHGVGTDHDGTDPNHAGRPCAGRPAAAGGARPNTRRSSHPSGGISLLWILPVALLSVGLAIGGALLYARRRRRGEFVSEPEARVETQTSGAGGGAIAGPEMALERADMHSNDDLEVGDISSPPTDSSAVFDLGVDLEANNDLAGAEAAYCRADELGHGAAASNLGVLLEAKGDRTGADAAYRRADERGEPNGAFNLAVLLETNDDLAGAAAAYRRADELGHGAAASNLGVLLEAKGDRTGAEAAYRRADERGEPNGAFNLAVLLEENDDLAGAEAAYRRAERSGDEKMAKLARAAVLDLVPNVGNQTR